MNWEVWLLFLVTETSLCFVPGPAVLLVLSQALARGAGASVAGNLGILSANGLYFILSATGLGAVILASYELFFLVKWVGAAYLIWIGVAAFRGRSSALSVGPAADGAGQFGRLFANGFILQAANPKAILFFAALLPQFIDPTGDIVLQVAILGVTSVVVEFIVLLGYGLVAGRASRIAAEPRFAAVTDRIAGSLLIVAGLGIAAIRHGD
jgi:threonine/homoserine/homoserine lactone efflux protein